MIVPNNNWLLVTVGYLHVHYRFSMVCTWGTFVMRKILHSWHRTASPTLSQCMTMPSLF